jgi:hypothetical protein
VRVMVRQDEAARREAHYAKMDQIAEQIVATPPPWLRWLLSDFSFDVQSAYSIHAMSATKRDLRKMLTNAGKLSIELSEGLLDVRLEGFLATNSEVTEAFVSDLISSLSKLASGACQARNSPDLVTPDGKIRPGRGKAQLPGVMPPNFVCAAVIAEIWRYFHDGKDPAPSNRRAWAAADAYWKAWPRSEKPWGSDPLTRWRRYFEEVDDIRLRSLRQEVARHLATRVMHHKFGI